MKVVVVSNNAWSLVHFRGELIKTMIAAGHELHVLAPGFEGAPEVAATLRSWSATPHAIEMSRAGLTPVQDLRLVFSLYRIFRDIAPDLVFGYTSKPVIYGTVAGWLAGVPNRFAMINGLGYAFTGEPRGKRRLVRWLLTVLYRFALKSAHGVFFQNPDDREDLRRLGVLGPQSTTIVVNGSGIDTAGYPQRPPLAGPLSFLLIARLIADKGIREYAAAAKEIRKRFPDVEFHLIGGFDPNPSRITSAEVREWSQSGAILFHGYVDDVRGALENCSVYVLPSYYREGTPRSILEALSIGRPVITTDAPGCRETVEDGVNGFLVPPRDVNALAAAMEQFLTRPDLIDRMGTASRQRATEKYDVHKVNTAMLKAMGLA